MIGRVSGKKAEKPLVLNLKGQHQRYQRQAQWTRHIRNYFFTKFQIPLNPSILEVGSGTGAVLGEYASNSIKFLYGLDINLLPLFFCQQAFSQIRLIDADVNYLPLEDGRFDLTFCHFLLLWLKNPSQALKEMKRVTRPGGWVCAFAEPDYDGHIVYPQAMEELVILQTESLAHQGVNTSMGRQLNQLFYQCGLKKVECGILAAEWKDNANHIANELQLIREDLDAIGKENDFINYEKQLVNKEEAIYFVPTFYAFGRA